MRYHTTAEGNIAFTAKEELERDNEEAAHLAAQPAIEKAAANAHIIAEMDAADLKIIRAIAEGDIKRLEAHKTSQALLRAKLL